MLNVLLVYDKHHHDEQIPRKLDYNHYRGVDDEPMNGDDYFKWMNSVKKIVYL